MANPKHPEKISILRTSHYQDLKSQLNVLSGSAFGLNALTPLLTGSKLIDLQELFKINNLITQIKATQQSLINAIIQKHLFPKNRDLSENNFVDLIEELNQIQGLLPERLADIKLKKITETKTETTIEIEGTPLPPKTLTANPEGSIQKTTPPCEITRTTEENSYKGLQCILEMPKFKVEHLAENSTSTYKPHTEFLGLKNGKTKIITKLPTDFEIQNEANSLYGLIDGIFVVERTETENGTRFFITPIQGHATFHGTQLQNTVTITAIEGEKLKKHAFTLNYTSSTQQPKHPANTSCSIYYTYTPNGTLLISLTIGVLSLLRTRNK